MESLIVAREALVDLVLRVGCPRLVVKLGDVVDDVLDAANDNLTSLVRHVNHAVKCAKNVLLEHVSIDLRDGVLTCTLLRIVRPHVLLVCHRERLLAVGLRSGVSCSVVQCPVLVHHELEVAGSLLGHVSLEVFIHLC